MTEKKNCVHHAVEVEHFHHFLDDLMDIYTFVSIPTTKYIVSNEYFYAAIDCTNQNEDIMLSPISIG